MSETHERKHRRALGAGLGISAVAHLALIGGYAVFAATSSEAPSPDQHVDAAEPETPTEIMRIVTLVTPSAGEASSAPAPDAETTSTLAVAEIEPTVEPVESPSKALSLDMVPIQTDLSLRVASMVTPRFSTNQVLHAAALTTPASQTNSTVDASSWYPGKYVAEDHEGHGHGLLGGFTLGIGAHCPSPGSRGGFTSINRVGPFGR